MPLKAACPLISPARLCILALLMLATCVGEAAIYRWVDDRGRVHFAAYPPTDQAQQLDIPEEEPPVRAPDMQQLDRERGEQRRKLLDTYREERELKRQAAEKQAQEQRQRQQNCAAARKRLDKYQRSSAIYETLEDGSRRFLSPEERAAELEQMGQAVQHWCDE